MSRAFPWEQYEGTEFYLPPEERANQPQDNTGGGDTTEDYMGKAVDEEIIQSGSMSRARERVRAMFNNRGVPLSMHRGGDVESDPTGRLNRIANEFLSRERSGKDIRESIQAIADEDNPPPAPTDRTDSQTAATQDRTQIAARIRDIFNEAGVPLALHVDGTTADPSARLDRMVDMVVNENGGFSRIRSIVQQTVSNNPNSLNTAQRNPEQQSIDYRKRAQQRVPWLPEGLIDEYANAWADTGDPQQALATVRQSPQYEEHFPGIRRDDGTLRMTEKEYMSTMDGYKTNFESFGVPSDMVEDQFPNLLKMDKSPRELEKTLSDLYTGVISRGPEIKQFYADNYGTNVSNTSILTSAITNANPAVVEKRIRNAAIGGTAAEYGFGGDMELHDINELRQHGLDHEAAQKTFARASRELPTLGALSQRYNAGEEPDINSYTDAVVLRNAEELQQMQRMVSAEQASFSANQSLQLNQQGELEGLDPNIGNS